ncbi:MAG: hypothetical protein RLZZ490_690 [Cyanobacteriota bacterium]
MQTLFTKALATSVAVAGLGLLAAPQAQAAIFFGSFALSGASMLQPGSDTPTVNPSPITPTIETTFCDNGTGAFAGTCDGSDPGSFVSITGLDKFVTTGPSTYSLSGFTITFNEGSGVVPGTVLPLTITVNPSDYGRTGGAQGSNIFSFPDLLTAVDDQGNTYTGSFSIGNAGGSSTYQMNFTTDNVPEPLTMLGASAAVAFGAAFKRRNANKG